MYYFRKEITRRILAFQTQKELAYQKSTINFSNFQSPFYMNWLFSFMLMCFRKNCPIWCHEFFERSAAFQYNKITVKRIWNMEFLSNYFWYL